MLAVFTVTTVWVLFEKGLASPTYQALHEPGMLLLVLALVAVSAGFHEFGHAAACRYVGATPGAMGVGLYLVWPVFFTDVTDSYRLGRRERSSSTWAACTSTRSSPSHPSACGRLPGGTRSCSWFRRSCSTCCAS
jgi:hypothetical protein